MTGDVSPVAMFSEIPGTPTATGQDMCQTCVGQEITRSSSVSVHLSLVFVVLSG